MRMFHRFRRKKVDPLVIPTITETLPQSPHQQHVEDFSSIQDVHRNSTTVSNLSSYNVPIDNARDGSVERRRRERSADRHADPLGLTVLYQPDEGPPVVNIIFVHGLGGTSQKTWCMNRNTEYFWPREWLPLERGLGQARILSFGYNAHFASSGRENILNIADFAKDLLFGMKFGLGDDSRELEIGTVPTVFVAHSMGGLVVKKAYILAQNDVHYEEVIKSARAILFLSTPHRGTNLAEILNKILSVSLFHHSAKQYIAELRQNSPALQDINEQFRNLAAPLQIFSFFETQQTAVGPRKMMVLEKDSSILGYPHEISKPLDADHHNVCKFISQQDPNYISVRNAIRSVVPKTNPGEKSTKAPSLNKTDMSKIEAMLAVSSAPEDDLEYFRSLWMPGSCEWVLSRPAFRSWIEDHSSRSRILFVSGLPGSGKSVLSSFIIEHLQEMNLSCQYYFFRFGDHAKRSVGLMLRSLAYQIARQSLQASTQLEKLAGDAVKFEKVEARTIWSKLFSSRLFKLQLQKPLYWVVDALDECEAPQRLLDIISSITQSQTPIRIMFIGRKTQALSTAFQRMDSSIEVSELPADGTKADLEAYVVKETKYMRGGPQIKARVISTVCDMACANFLWVRLVLREILQCHTEAEIEEALLELPVDLEPLYQRMAKALAESSRPGDRALSKKILTWVVCSQRALSVDELSEALQPEHDVLDLRLTINQICGDFIVVDNKSRIEMVHQTAREYLIKTPGLEHSITPRTGHEDLLLKCISYLSALQRRHKTQRPSTQVFAHYAATCWPYHLRLSAASLDHTTLLVLSQFFQGPSVLFWIQLLAQQDHLRTLVFASQNIMYYLGRKSKVDEESSPLTHRLQEKEMLELWTTDLVKIVGKFGAQLVKYPRSIHDLVPALCPSTSAIYQHSGQSKTKQTISVGGSPRQQWDDCLSKFSAGRDHQAQEIVCLDRYFVILTSEGTLRLYDTVTGQPSKRIVHGERVLTFKFSATYEKCVTYGFRTTKVWQVHDGRHLCSITNPNNAKALDVAFSADDSTIMTCSDDRRVRQCHWDSSAKAWEALDMKIESDGADGRQFNSPRRVAFNADGTRLAVAFRGFPLMVWDMNTADLVGRCERISDRNKSRQDLHTDVGPICWNPVTGHVLGLYNDGCVFKWYPSEVDSQELRTIATGIHCSSGGALFLTNSTDGALKVWDFHHFSIVYQLSCHVPVTDIALSPDGRRIYDIRDTFCNVWEPNALIRLAETDEKSSDSSSTTAESTQLSLSSEASNEVKEPLTALSIGARTSSFCTGDEVGVLRLHIANAEASQQIAQGFMPVDHVVWSQDERYLVTADLGGRLNVRSMDGLDSSSSYRMVLEVKSGIGLQQALVRPTSEHLLISTVTLVELWSLKSKSLITTIPNTSPYSQWINHPQDSSSVVRVSFSEIHVFQWADLAQKATFSLDRGSGRMRVERSESEASKVPSAYFPMTPDENRNAVDQAIVSDTYGCLVIQTSSPSGQRHRTLQYLVIDPREMSMPHTNIEGIAMITAHALPTAVATRVQRILGFVTKNPRRRSHGLVEDSKSTDEEILTFIDHDDWVCSCLVEGYHRPVTIDKKIKRHFFLPQDWVNLDNLRLATVSREGQLFYPRNGEVAVISNWLQNEWSEWQAITMVSSHSPAAGRRSDSIGNEARSSDGEKQESIDKTVIPYSVFSKSSKRWIVFFIALAGFFSPLSANIYFPSLNYLAHDLNVSLELINLTITAYLVCQGIVPAIVGDMADTAGRRPVYIAGFIVYLAANVGLALQNSYPALLILRILQSSGSSAPSLGPVLGGVLAERASWRWIFWFLAILSGLCLLLIIAFLPETARKFVGNGSIQPTGINRSLISYMARSKEDQPAQEVTQPRLRVPNPISCLRIVFHKDTALVLVANAVFYMNYSCMQASLSPLLMNIYNLNALQVGLAYLPYGIACGVASFLVGQSSQNEVAVTESAVAHLVPGKVMNDDYKKTAAAVGFTVDKTKGDDLANFPIEKARLRSIWYFVSVSTACTIGYGWTLQARTVCNTLIVDLHPDSPATASASVSIVRCSVAAIGVSILQFILDRLGPGWTFTLFGGLGAATAPMLWAEWRWGMLWRNERLQKGIERNGERRPEVNDEQ
ncbi:MAG: hypothetical protein Q9202_003125 [Teloschistes flavicans]